MHIPPRSYGSAKMRARRSFVARRIVLPSQKFFATEGLGSVLLLAAAVAAVAWANSPYAASYDHVFETVLGVQAGPFAIRMPLRDFINDALMAIFFYVVGLEIKGELLSGEISDPRRAALPAIAAMGGMVTPALIYAAVNAGGAGAKGWGIPMATDIAFAVGILILLGDRVTASLRVFLLALAIVDDLGAILVIAAYYTESISVPMVSLAAALLVVIVVMRWGGMRGAAYLPVVLLFWAAVFKSGIHATIAGVILGVLTPAKPWFSLYAFAKPATRLLGRFRRALEVGDFDRAESVMGRFEELSKGTESPLDRRLRGLHPWSAYAVLPLFALANSGVVLSRESLAGAWSSRVSWGIALGLLVGKPVGIAAFAWLAVRLKVATLPEGVTWRQVLGVGVLAGIGFTVSLFVSELAFADHRIVDDAKIGILAASIAAGAAGFAFLRVSQPPRVVARQEPEFAAAGARPDRADVPR